MVNGILNHLRGITVDPTHAALSHMESDRIDIYVNGVQNLSQELEDSTDKLQQHLDELTFGSTPLPLESPKHTPVIGLWNWSSKHYSGGYLHPADRDWFDGSDCLRGKAEAALPTLPTTNFDTIKLIGLLRAATEVLWGAGYEEAFYRARMRPEFVNQNYGTHFWEFSGDSAKLRDLVPDYFLKNAEWDSMADRYRNPVYRAWIVPQTAPTFELQYGVNTLGKTPEQIWSARVELALAELNSKQYPRDAEGELDRLRANLEKVQLTLHAHSQGAILAVAASRRVGAISRSRSFSADEMDAGQGTVSFDIHVAPQFKFVGYGGGANMLDFGSEKRFASYVHHLNEQDGVTYFVGMADPFQQSPLVQGLSAIAIAVQTGVQVGDLFTFNLPKTLAMRAGFGALVQEVLFSGPNPAEARVLTGPTATEINAWRSFHRVIWHRKPGASSQTLNPEHHNFYNAYACSAGTEDTAPVNELPVATKAFRLMLTKSLSPLEGVGAPDCLHD